METTIALTSQPLSVWLAENIGDILDRIGLRDHSTTREVIYVAIVVIGSLAVAWLLQHIIYLVLRKIVQLRDSSAGRELLRCKTLSKICYIIPPLLMLGMMPFAFSATHVVRTWLMRCLGVYALASAGLALGAIMDFVFSYYNMHDNKKNVPLKGVLNVGKGVMWIVLFICAISVLIDRSPAYLLTGLGAFAAALMLIFKDSILGFVAGVQMGENDMIHVGDWIVVPGTPANGIVLDMTLSAVKVQNFDNTIVTVPPYTLVSTSFQNYRGMKLSGARRITKTFVIDFTTVKKITPGEALALAKPFPRLTEFVQNLIKNGQTAQNDGGLTPINGTIETNLGLFRAYLSLYIYYNPNISDQQQLLIQILDPTSSGLPLQVYCFTNTTDWDKYEAIQSDIIEHVTTMVGDFGLALYYNGSLTVDLDNPAPEKPAPKKVQAASGTPAQDAGAAASSQQAAGEASVK